MAYIIPKNWDEVESKEVGDFTNLTIGGHICKILDVREYTSEMTGNTSLKVSIDIAEGSEFDDYFRKQYDKNTLSEAKWPSGAVKYLSLKEEQTSYLKGFITAVENSNPGTKIKVTPGKELDYEQFKNKKIVGVFALEEYENDKKELKTATKLTQFRSLDKLDEIQEPKVKLLNGEYVTYDDYEEFYRDRKKSNNETKTNVTISDDMLPF